MRNCDALIIGGGPAGSTCARRLSAAGLDVVVLDKRQFPRDKTCAGWITPAVIAELDLDTADYASSRAFQPITGFRTGIIGRRIVQTAYDRPVSFGIRRCEFDHYLLQRCGAHLALGERVETIERSGRSWIINGSFASPLLIGAGGHTCPVARQACGALPGKELAVVAQEIEFPLNPDQRDRCAVQASTPELYFCPDSKGYGWCFRKGDYLNIGLGREDDRGIADHVASFRRFLIDQGRIPPDVPEKFHGHAYILYGHTKRRLCDDGVMLIGDAAGLAYPESGEGIRPAIESGMLAAAAALQARGDYSARSLRAYENAITRRFGPRPARGASAGAPASALKQAVASCLMATRWFSRRVLIEKWFLHAHQPALATP